jgi:tRNA(fMet)-specific endonuclease VapC
MIVLDTDHISVLQHESPAAVELRRRILQVTDDDVVTTVVTYEEQMRSWLGRIGQTRDVRNQVAFYERLAHMADFFGEWTLMPFTDAAAGQFLSLRQQKLRISTMDLKIACIVLQEQATLLSRNLSDFGQVPGLHVENWLAD